MSKEELLEKYGARSMFHKGTNNHTVERLCKRMEALGKFIRVEIEGAEINWLPSREYLKRQIQGTHKQRVLKEHDDLVERLGLNAIQGNTIPVPDGHSEADVEVQTCCQCDSVRPGEDSGDVCSSRVSNREEQSP